MVFESLFNAFYEKLIQKPCFKVILAFFLSKKHFKVKIAIFCTFHTRKNNVIYLKTGLDSIKTLF